MYVFILVMKPKRIYVATLAGERERTRDEAPGMYLHSVSLGCV